MHPGIFVLALVLVGVGAMLCAATALLMAWSLVHPPRMTDGKAAWVLRRLSPGDVGLAFEEARFDIRDERGNPLKIAAWWIPCLQARGRCAVILHGYADAKVGAIAWAPLWHALGYNLLVPDLRAHGESDGAVCTAGFFERNDLGQVLDELRASRPDDARQLVLFGISMGAAVAAATAAQRSDIAAVIMESPYAEFSRAAAAHMDLVGLPGRFLQRPALRLAQWLTNADFTAVRPADLIAQLPCPVLVIESGFDAFLAPEDRAMLAAAVKAHRVESGPAEIWTVEGAEHLMALTADPAEYQRRIGDFLTRAGLTDETPAQRAQFSRTADYADGRG